MNIFDYVVDHTARGECRCGRCCDRGNKPDPGHSVDTGFFRVALCAGPDSSQADSETFKRLIAEHSGEFVQMNPLDGNPHNYIEIGGWIGDQGVAMQFMAMGELLKVWGMVAMPTGPVILPTQLADMVRASLASRGDSLPVGRRQQP
jgi:hypothetical protein